MIYMALALGVNKTFCYGCKQFLGQHNSLDLGEGKFWTLGITGSENS